MLQNFPGGAKLGWVAIQHAPDLQEGSFNILDLESRENKAFPVPGRPGFFTETTRTGVVLLGLERRLALLDLNSGDLEETGIEVTGDERVIINDGLPVEGGVIFGTKHLEFNLPVAELYYFEAATRRVRTILYGQMCSNGKFALRDAEGLTLIDIDSIPRTISRYRFDPLVEHLLARSLVTPPEALPSIPDGLRPSPDGQSVIVAFYNPEPVADGFAQQIRLSDGAVECEWRLPGSPRVTCPELVMLGGKVKVIFTTAIEAMPEETRKLAPGAGALYVADTPFDTVPALPPLVHV